MCEGQYFQLYVPMTRQFQLAANHYQFVGWATNMNVTVQLFQWWDNLMVRAGMFDADKTLSTKVELGIQMLVNLNKNDKHIAMVTQKRQHWTAERQL